MEKMFSTNYKKNINNPSRKNGQRIWMKIHNIHQPTNIVLCLTSLAIGKMQIQTAMSCQLHHEIGKTNF